jgi:hypothetical protein
VKDQDHRDTVVFLVDLPACVSPTIRINVTLPGDLIAAIDRVSSNRSRFLADAARAELKRVN